MSQPPQDDWDAPDPRAGQGRHDTQDVHGEVHGDVHGEVHDDHALHDVRGDGHRFEDGLLGLGGDRHDDSLADEMLEPPAEEEMLRPRRRRRRNPVVRGVALLLALGLVVVAGVYSFGAVRELLPEFSLGGEPTAEDYEGAGSGEVMVEIPEGASGGQIGEILVDNGVVASVSAFTAAIAADTRGGSIQPGTYRMAEQMSSQAALSRLLDGGYREVNGVTIREGLWVAETFEILAEQTGHEVADYEGVDPADLDLPEAADGELEGFLFPSTYEFPADAGPQEQLQMMIDQGKAVHAELGLEGEELRDVVIKASIIQGEGMYSEDLTKIARVIENRLDPNPETNGYLQMDSTVHFIYQERGLAGTTDEQRDNPDLHNTYYHPGLPSGPINSPGEEAIQAAMNPEPGDWLFFVTVNPSTGETKFADSFAEHEENRREFEEWCAENRDQC